MYDNPEYMNSTMPRMPPGGNPYDSQQQQQQGYTIVEDPRAGYFSTATLPSNAALRKPSGPGYVVLVNLDSLFSILELCMDLFAVWTEKILHQINLIGKL